MSLDFVVMYGHPLIFLTGDVDVESKVGWCGGEVEEGGEMLICRFYTQPVSTQAGADGDDEGDDGGIKIVTMST